MTHWEYRVVGGGDHSPQDTQAALNLLGAEGWELVGTYQQAGREPQFVLKRPLRESPPPPPTHLRGPRLLR